MKLPKLKLLDNRLLLLLVLLLLVGGGFALGYRTSERHHRVDDMPGTVIGNNFRGIPESKLPECDFDGSRFLQEPCYSPPGMLYD